MTSFLILGLVVLFCVGFSQQQSCSITSNQDINLPDLAVRSGQPQESCCSICQSTPGCKGFAYNGYEGGTCWLKAGTGPLIYKENVNVGILGSTASGGACSIRSNQDINLPDLQARYGQPQEACCGICKNTLGCKGFAWNAYEGGTCWLKAGTGPVIAKEGVNIGFIDGGTDSQSGSSGCTPIETNRDIALPDLAARYGQPQENCCSICSSTQGCKGFAWNAHEGGTCWLKAGTGPVVYMEGVNVGILNGNGGSDNSGGNNNGVSFDEFANAVVNSNGYPRPSEAQYNAFIQGLPKGLIATKQEAAMALTQFLHESDGLRAKREYRCQDSGCPGEYVTSGCDGPNQRYYGRGYIQLTWCYNYRAASQDLYNDNRLVSDADMVARDENVAWNTAFWFWKANVHNIAGVADGAFGVTTRAINGGLECNNSAGHPIARQRYAMYGRVRAAFGLGGPGSEWGCYN
ncbi:chitinase 1-like isoform X2 [Bradysia coprophila]|uniref:chitinase 1-like isoform X2 n=1 Tax=Bradysia coprophila TaxID=38358 RepID=UPI00187DD0F6|nr:chitinase 1-like isoform X2 [Bradysia coprophila]